MPPRSEYGRTTRDGKQIWYVMVDESGHPYYDPQNPGPFAMGAMVTGDPMLAFDIINSVDSKDVERFKKKGTNREHKHSRSKVSEDEGLMDEISKAGFAMVATNTPIYNPTDNSIDTGSVVYAGTLSRLLRKVAEVGPDGLYRIRIDESEYLDDELLEVIARSAFSGYEDVALMEHSPVRMYDSSFDPPIQLADEFVGDYRKALMRGDEREYAKKRRIVLTNRKFGRKSPGSTASLQSNAGLAESRDPVAGVIPYPSDSRYTGSPGLVSKHRGRGI